MSRNAQLRNAISHWLLPALLGYLVCGACSGAAAGLESTLSALPRARVVAIEDSDAIQTYRAQPDNIRRMVNRGLTNLTGKVSVAEAWRSLVRTQDVVGLKVYSLPGPNSGTRPAVVAAVVEGLLDAGLPAQQIIVWDKESKDLRLAGFYDLATRYGIRVAGSAQAGYDESVFYETALLGTLVWGDLEFGKKGAGIGRRSYVSKLLSKQITRIINISPLLNHNLAGVSGNLYSLAAGSVDNFSRFETDTERLSSAVPEIYALPVLCERVALNLTDALICQYEGGERGLLHYSAILNQIRLSTDPVALDVLSLRDLDHQRQVADAPPVKTNFELYNNAALLELGASDMKRIQLETLK